MKQPVYPLYVPQDEQAVRPVLDALKQKGVTVREAGEPKRGDAVVFFLSEHVAEDSPAAAQFVAIQSRTATLIPVMLDGSTPPELIRNALLARHSIAAERYDADELSERIASALKKKNPLPWIIGIAALAAVLVASAILLIRAIGKTPDTPAATVEPTEVPEPTPVPRVPSEAGIKPEDLARVYQLFIIGDRMEVLYGDEGYAARFGYAKIDATNYANRFDDENGSHWTDNTTGEEILLHTWEDLDFLRYMTNLKFLDVILVEGTLPDLKELTNLDYVHIDSCKLDSLNGLAGCRFTTLEYRSEAMDFSPLSDCPRLRNVSLGLEGDLPDDLDTFGPPTVLELNLYVSGAPKIRTLSGLSACRGLSDVTLNNLLIRDLTCLEHATKLSSLNLNDLHDLTSMNGMMEHRNMTDLTIDNCEALIDLNALIACPNLKDVHLFDLRTEDLFFLSGATGISDLEVRYSDTIRSAHGLENHMTLKDLNLEGLYRLTDISALSTCTSLDHVCIMDSHNLIDVSPIVGLPKLYKLELYGAGPDHVNYLSDIVNKNYFSFGVAEVHDWSGLLAIRRYNWLNITDHNGSALPYLQDAMIDRFELWYRSDYNNGSDSPIDYSVFPTVYDQLTLHGVPSLVGLPASNVTSIRIDNSDFLTSLDGFQNLNRLRDDAIVDLYVGECPRLTDWSALNGVSLSRLEISGMFTLPDFGTFSVRRIRLESIVDLTDLAPLAALNPDKRYDEIALFDVDGVTDLSPLYRLKGNKLSVPAHLGQQAALLQESGNFTQIEIVRTVRQAAQSGGDRHAAERVAALRAGSEHRRRSSLQLGRI